VSPALAAASASPPNSQPLSKKSRIASASLNTKTALNFLMPSPTPPPTSIIFMYVSLPVLLSCTTP
jgi:hypothetical protein